MVPYVLSVLALFGMALLLGGTVYEAVVMAPNYERDIPDSIDIARRFLKRTTPAHFFRLITPVTQILLLGGVVACWSVSSARWQLLMALGILLCTDVMTFTFHYPRLAVMFKEPLPADPERMRRAAKEWTIGNFFRAALLIGATLTVLEAVTTLALRR